MISQGTLVRCNGRGSFSIESLLQNWNPNLGLLTQRIGTDKANNFCNNPRESETEDRVFEK
jgi:hypothetical protein